MGTSESRIPRFGGFGTGVCIGLMLVAPVFAATSSWPPQDWANYLPQDWANYLLGGSIALLVIGVVLRLAMPRNPPVEQPAVRPDPSAANYCIDAYRIGALNRSEAA